MLGKNKQTCCNSQSWIFIGVYQNFKVFIDELLLGFTDTPHRDDNQPIIVHGKPLIFFGALTQAIRINDGHSEVVEIGKDRLAEKNTLVFDEIEEIGATTFILSELQFPHQPVPIDVSRVIERPVFGPKMIK